MITGNEISKEWLKMKKPNKCTWFRVASYRRKKSNAMESSRKEAITTLIGMRKEKCK